MKKILFIILMLVLTSHSIVRAESNTSSTANRAQTKNIASEADNKRILPTKAVRNDSDKLSDLKSRADKEIQRRIDALNKLITRINAFKRLSSAQKSTLTSQIQTQIDGLNSLKTKIDADTDLATLKTDVKSIVTDYRIFVFFIEYINITAAAERMGTALDNLTTLSGKLQTRISDAQSNGTDVSNLNIKYSDLQAKLADAKKNLDEVNSQVSGLTASGYPGNKTTLMEGRKKLRTAFIDLQTAYEDSFEIIRSLKQVNIIPTKTPVVKPES